MQNKMIRLFVSSTFRDFEKERNTLMRQVYPKLEALCKKNGFSFQVIDLRWGVSKEDVAENRSVWICFDEIRRCRELSPQLNFLVMVGNRYGWRPLPTEIDADEWEQLTKDMACDSYMEDLLRDYYRKDLNRLDQKYILLPRGNLNQPEHDEFLRMYLETQAKEKLSGEAVRKYSASATEQEIVRGYFQSDEFRIHTFVMVKETDEEEKENTELEQDELQASARKLKDELIRTIERDGNTNQLYIHRQAGESYLKRAEDFLTDVIRKQIEEYITKTDFENERDTLNNLYQSISGSYVFLPWHERAIADCESRPGSCILLAGASGCGKSYFLKNMAMTKEICGEKVAAVFNDVQPLGCSLASSLEFLVESLCEQGVLERDESTMSHENPVVWFEYQLQRIQTDIPITIIIDSIDNISDYKQAEKGLFQMEIPECVTIIASAKSTDDLLQSDIYPEKPEVIQIEALSREAGISLLTSLLKARSRVLQPDQIEQVKSCLSESGSALQVELMAQICEKLHSWDAFPYQYVCTLDELVRIILFHEGRDDYHTFRTHALGYIALSSVGLAEAELIDLLSQDQEVVDEIQRQTEWNFEIINPGQDVENRPEASSSYRGKIPVALWAMLYADIRNLLTMIVDHGIYLLQIRHSLLKNSILQAITGKECEKLLNVMNSYFGEQMESWILKDEGRITANRRKVCELFPIYEKLMRFGDIRKELDNLLCADAFVRCGMREKIRTYLNQYAVDGTALEILNLLRKKDMLFRLWPDSFLQAALSEFRLKKNVDEDIQEKKKILKKINQTHLMIRKGIGFSGEGMFFPQLDDTCRYALNDNGIVAVYSHGTLRIIDMNQRIFTQTACATVRENCFLYWNGSFLVVRCAHKRLYYLFEDWQLVEYRRENCPDWGNLLTENKIPKAGGRIEAEAFGTTVHQGYMKYFTDEKMVGTHLFYDFQRELYVRTHGSLAAIVIDGKRLEIVDLYQEKVIQRYEFSAVTQTVWASHGKEILVVIRENTLARMKIDKDTFIDDMPRPNKNYQQHLLGSIIDSIEDFGEDIVSFSSMERNAVSRISSFSQDLPIYAALSVKYGWFACYYNRDNIGQLQMYHLSDHKPCWKMAQETDVIRTEDVLELPMYPACDRNGLIFIAGKKARLLDLEQKKWIPAPMSALRKKEREPEIHQRIREEYINFMVKELHLRTPLESVESKAKVRIKGFLSRFRPEKRGLNLKEYRMYRPYLNLCNSEVLKEEKAFWLVDSYHGILLAYDFDGNCICKDMIGDRILAADVWNGRLYLLPERTEQIIEVWLAE